MAGNKTGIRLRIIDLETIKCVVGSFAGEGAFVPDNETADTKTLEELADWAEATLNTEFPDMETPFP